MCKVTDLNRLLASGHLSYIHSAYCRHQLYNCREASVSERSKGKKLLMASTVCPKMWQEIYFGGLAVLRAIYQYFICQNLHNVMSSLLKNHLCTRLAARHASLIMAWNLPLKPAYEDIASPNSFIHRRRRVSWSVNVMKAIQMTCTRPL